MQTKTQIILVIAEIHKSGGTERAVTNLANDLTEVGNNVKLLSIFTKNQTPFYSLSTNIEVEQLGLVFEKSFPKRLLIGVKNLYRKLKEYYNSHTDVVFIATDPFISFILSLIHTKNDNNKVIVCEHMALSIANPFSITIRKLLFKKVNAIVALTQRDTVFLHKILPDTSIYEIPNRTTYKTDEIPISSTKTLVAIGRFEKQKNFIELIQIFGLINSQNKDWRLIIVGNGSLKPEIELEIQQLNLTQYVDLIPISQDVKTLFKESSIYVMTSIYEGFPMVLLEAMASSLPIISYDCPNGPKELIENGQTGYLIEMHDKQEFVNKTLALMNDASLRISFGENAKKRAESTYSKETIIKKWDELLKAL